MQARRTRFKPRSKLETRKVYVEAHADKTKLETLVLGKYWKTESGGRIQALEWHLANKNFQLGDKCSRLEGDCSRLFGATPNNGTKQRSPNEYPQQILMFGGSGYRDCDPG